MSRAYYNEIDAFAAQWLRNLIAEGHIAPGDVDERSIEDVRPTDLVGYTQCHFFAGIGVWSSALRGAGWPDDRPVWTGSCPCQPFSQAGKGAGVADERHLWPAWFHLIEHAKPSGVPVYGEQVANGDGLTWLDIVQADLEGAGYAFGAVDLCAAGFGAPHIRQRIFFYADRMGDTNDQGLEGRERVEHTGERILGALGMAGGLADSGHIEHSGWNTLRGADGEHDGAQEANEGSGSGGHMQGGIGACDDVAIRSAGDRLAHAAGVGRRERSENAEGCGERSEAQGLEQRLGHRGICDDERPGPANGYWRAADWLFCRDGKWRAVEPGTFPLAHGAPGRVGRLRANGNAINREVAIGFIVATMGCVSDRSGTPQAGNPAEEYSEERGPRNEGDAQKH